MSFTTPLRRDRRGIAALEFALALPVLLLVMGTLIDVGLIWRARGKLAVAVEAGEQYAVLTGTSFSNQSGFAHGFGHQRLTKPVVGFMCTTMKQVFAF